MTGSTRALRGSVLIALAVVITDQATKHWAVNRLADGPIDLFWTLRLNLVFNRGMAFSRGQGFGPVIAVVSAVIVVALLVAVARGTGALGTVGRLGTVGTGLVVGGAVGNLIDRLFRGDAWLRGAVVDFVDLQWFPVFNVADASINIGAGVLILGAVLQGRRERAEDVDDAGEPVGERP